jgi:hypothetical protein
MKVQTAKKLLKASYDNKKPNIENYQRNEQLSGKRAQVFYDPTTKKAVVVHRGAASATDWVKTNLPMALGYEGANRFKHAKKIQKKAENLYGSENTITMGHSLGGRLAEKFGGKSSQTITYNRAVTPRSLLTPTRKTQTNIRAKGDLVSALGVFQRKQGTEIQINKRKDPLTAHLLPRLNKIKNRNI